MFIVLPFDFHGFDNSSFPVCSVFCVCVSVRCLLACWARSRCFISIVCCFIFFCDVETDSTTAILTNKNIHSLIQFDRAHSGWTTGLSHGMDIVIINLFCCLRSTHSRERKKNDAEWAFVG